MRSNNHNRYFIFSFFFISSSIGFDLSEVLEDLSEKLLKTLSKRAKNRSKDSIRKIGLPIF